MSTTTLSLEAIRALYSRSSPTVTPTTLITQLYPQLIQSSSTFTYLLPLDQLLQRCTQLEGMPESIRGTLWGVPFAVKDNVDVAGVPTTAACPAFSYVPSTSALGVDALLQAGAIMVGKTNMDQFAAGLVGTRTPYGPPPVSPFDSRFISGGSSSGSAVAVGGGLVSFALGTDTAGSGRVPAGLCGCVGIKPTVGSVSTVGVVPACASLDCLTVFACSVSEGAELTKIMRSATAGDKDIWRRLPSPLAPQPSTSFRFAVPSVVQLDWSGPGGEAVSLECQRQFDAAIDRLKAVGGQQVDIDFEPFMAIASMLYGTSFVAERYSGLRKFLEAGPRAAAVKGSGGSANDVQACVVNDERLLPVTRHIISGAAKFSATDVFDHKAQMAVLSARCQVQLQVVDILLVPTALTHYTTQEVQDEESSDTPTWTKNAKLGRFTNFVNLLDLCGVSLPSGLVRYDAAQLSQSASDDERRRAAHLAATGPTHVTLPFGVTLLSHGWRDEWLWGVASRMEDLCGLKCGPGGHGVVPYVAPTSHASSGCSGLPDSNGDSNISAPMILIAADSVGAVNVKSNEMSSGAAFAAGAC